MTIQELNDLLLTYPGSRVEFPFDHITPVYKTGKKMFALIAGIEKGPARINLKCDPENALMLRHTYESVTPGYHMNKKHWNSVYLGGDVPDHELCRMIDESYHLVINKNKRNN